MNFFHFCCFWNKRKCVSKIDPPNTGPDATSFKSSYLHFAKDLVVKWLLVVVEASDEGKDLWSPFRNLRNGSTLCNRLHLAHESQQPLIIQGLLIEKSAQDLASSSYTPIPNTSIVRRCRVVENPVNFLLKQVFMNTLSECRCAILSHHWRNWSNYRSSLMKVPSSRNETAKRVLKDSVSRD